MRQQNLKVVCVGDSTVGKSSLIDRLAHNKYNHNNVSTIGIAYNKYTHTCTDGTQLVMDLWDTAGQERYRSLIPMYYQHAEICLLVFDVTDRATYLNIGNIWYDELQKYLRRYDQQIRCYLVANKLDLVQHDEHTLDAILPRRIFKEEAVLRANSMTLSQDMGEIKYFEVSAKTGDGIQALLDDLCENAKELISIQPKKKLVALESSDSTIKTNRFSNFFSFSNCNIL